MILPLFLKTPFLEKVIKEVLTAVELLNFVRIGINTSFGTLFCSLHTTYFDFFNFYLFFLFPDACTSLCLQKKVLEQLENM